MVPAAGCPLDGYGNPKPSFIVQMIAYFNAFGEQGYKANMTDASRKRFESGLSSQYGGRVAFFISRGNMYGTGLPAGIWMRVSYAAGSAVKPVFLFVRQGNYRQLIRLEDVVRETFNKYGMRLIDEHLQAAIEGRQTFPDLS